MATPIEIYNKRSELKEMIDPATGKYLSLRTTKNLVVLEDILTQLKQKGQDYVIASWISPPFGIVQGYGVYTKKEAAEIAHQSQSERWGFPRFGAIYDQERLEKRIEALKKYIPPGLIRLPKL